MATTCSDCTPLTYATAILAIRYGSSPKLSKLLPPTGTLLMFMQGPRSIFRPFAFASTPSASPSRRMSCGSQVAAIAMLAGNAVDFSQRTPTGPSVMLSVGIPRRVTGFDSNPVPPSMEIFSSSVICLIVALIFASISPCARAIPAQIVIPIPTIPMMRSNDIRLFRSIVQASLFTLFENLVPNECARTEDGGISGRQS